MGYYVLLYIIKRYMIKYVPHIMVAVGIIAALVYWLWFPYKYETGSQGLYGISTLYRWLPYFDFMLFGAWMGIKREKLMFRPVADFAFMMISLVLFYGIQLLAKKQPEYAPWQIVTLLPLMGFVFYFYKWCNADFWKKLYNKNVVRTIIMTVSGLCLESYLIQYSVFTTKMNGIFPLNLPIMICIVLMVAFLCKCLSRVFAQTFKDEDYHWRDVIKLY